MAIFKYLQFAVLLLGMLLTGCKEKETQLSNSESHDVKHRREEIVLTPKVIKEIGIEIGKPQQIKLQQSFIAQGKVIVNPDYVAHINTLVSGRVCKIYAQIGEQVKQGQPLFELESLEISNLVADFIRNKAEFEAKKSEYERINILRSRDIKTEKDMIAAKANFERAAAEFQAADRILHSIGLGDDDTEKLVNNQDHGKFTLVVRNPIDGIVTERNIEMGQLLEPNMDAMKVIDNTRIWVEAQVYEKDYANLKKHQDVTVSILSLPSRSFAGKVRNINKELDAQSRTVKVFITVENSKSEMMPNMFARINFSHGEGPLALVVHRDAIQFDGITNFVFVEVKTNAFIKREVNIGRKTRDLVEITSGLSPEDNVVFMGAFYLKSEMKKEKLGEVED